MTFLFPFSNQFRVHDWRHPPMPGRAKKPTRREQRQGRIDGGDGIGLSGPNQVLQRATRESDPRTWPLLTTRSELRPLLVPLKSRRRGRGLEADRWLDKPTGGLTSRQPARGFSGFFLDPRAFWGGCRCRTCWSDKKGEGCDRVKAKLSYHRTSKLVTWARSQNCPYAVNLLISMSSRLLFQPAFQISV